jgi:hypothetical protein
VQAVIGTLCVQQASCAEMDKSAGLSGQPVIYADLLYRLAQGVTVSAVVTAACSGLVQHKKQLSCVLEDLWVV